MTKTRGFLAAPFFVALLGVAFCFWSARGNDVNFCVTTGCSLYQDFRVAGLSLWWIGTGAFSLLAVIALPGLAGLGRALAALCLLGDVCLLLLMALTAPCVNCMGVACFFAAVYALYRRASQPAAPQKNAPVSNWSWLLCVWGVLFVVNLALVARSWLDIWPILDESGQARQRVFFSPSCPHCVKSVDALSGNVEVAFYPVAENDADLFKIANMERLLNEGQNIAEALGQSLEIEDGGFFASLRPDLMLLKFRLLRNKAHVLAASPGVPFFEFLGAPPGLTNQSRGSDKNFRIPSSGDASLPLDIDGGQCVSGQPCPPPAN